MSARSGRQSSTADRRRGFDAERERRTLLPLLLAWGVGMAVLGVVFAHAPEARTELLLDPAADGSLPWYVGLVAKLGILGWCAATVAAAGGGFAARIGGRSKAASVLNGAALLCALLMIDDLFLLHSAVLSKQLPASKLVIVGVYALAIVLWTLTNLGELSRTRWRILLAGGVGLATSGVVDAIVAPKPTATGALLIEDGAKFLGILAVATYFVLTAADIIRSIIQAPDAHGPAAELDDALQDIIGA